MMAPADRLFDVVLVWVRYRGEWHSETEEGMTLCALTPPTRAQRTLLIPDVERCVECATVKRRLEEV